MTSRRFVALSSLLTRSAVASVICGLVVPGLSSSITLATPVSIAAIHTASRSAVVDAYRQYVLIPDRTPAALGWTGSIATCTPGTISAAARDASFNRTNWYRAMSGAVSVTESVAQSADAQAAALVQAASGSLSHSPPPTAPCYTAAGANGSANSNLYGGGGTPTTPALVDGWIDDYGVSGVGHRMGTMSPTITTMGYGHVQSGGSFAAAQYWIPTTFAARSVTGNAGVPASPVTGTLAMAWPPNGFVPHTNVYRMWSLSYPGACFSSATVSVVRAGVPYTPALVADASNCYSAAYSPESRATWDMTSVLTGTESWSIYGDRRHIKPTADVPYTVTVSGVVIGGVSRSFTYTSTVIDPSTKPTGSSLSSATVAEESATGTVIGTLSALGDVDYLDAWTFALDGTVPGALNNSLVSISGSQLKVAGRIDFDAPANLSQLKVGVKVTDDAGNTASTLLTISVTPVAEAPTAVGFGSGFAASSTVLENKAVGTVVGSLSGADPEGGVLTYTLVAGLGSTDNSKFAVSSAGVLTTAAVLDFETLPTAALRARVTDSTGLWFERALTVAVTNVNESPTSLNISSSIVAEESALGSLIGVLSPVGDPDAANTFTFTLEASVAGATSNGYVTVTGDQLLVAARIDADAPTSLTVLKVGIRVTDQGGLSATRLLTLTVAPINESPTSFGFGASQTPSTNAAENSPAGTALGTLSASDPEGGPFTYALVAGAGGTDNSSVQISPAGVVTTTRSYNYEATPTLSIRVSVADGTGQTLQRILTVIVGDVNEAPSALSLSSTTVAAGSAHAAVGTLTAADPDAGALLTYSLVGGTGDSDNALFTIAGQSLVSTTSLPLTPSTRSVRIRVSDQFGLSFDQTFTIVVVSQRTYVPVNPARLLDTRTGGATIDGLLAGIGTRNADTTTTIQISSRGNIANNATTATLNIIALTPTGTGYLTLWPCDQPRPNASTLNYTTGTTIANAALTKLSATGTVCIYTSTTTGLIVDTTGSYTD